MTTATIAVPWPREVERCRKCGTNAYSHNGRGLCGACYQWLYRRGKLGDYAPLRVHGNGGTDSWAASPVHRVVYRNHKRIMGEKWARLLRIWNTDGAFLNATNCVLLTDPPPSTGFPARGWGERRETAA